MAVTVGPGRRHCQWLLCASGDARDSEPASERLGALVRVEVFKRAPLGIQCIGTEASSKAADPGGYGSRIHVRWYASVSLRVAGARDVASSSMVGADHYWTVQWTLQ